MKTFKAMVRPLERPNRDRKKPHGPSLPHHRTHGSRIRRFDELNAYRAARLGTPRFLKKANGNAMVSAGVFDSRHGPCADLLVHPKRRWRSSRSRARSSRVHHASYPVFVHRPAISDWTPFRPRLATTSLPFSLPSALRKPGHRTRTYEVTRHARRTVKLRGSPLRGCPARTKGWAECVRKRDAPWVSAIKPLYPNTRLTVLMKE